LSIKNILGKKVIIIYGKDNVVGLLERRFANPRAILNLIKDGEFEFRYFERGGVMPVSEIITALKKPVDYTKSVYPNKLLYKLPDGGPGGGHYRDPYRTDGLCKQIASRIKSLGPVIEDGDGEGVPISSSAVRQTIYYASHIDSIKDHRPTLDAVLASVLLDPINPIMTSTVFNLMTNFSPKGPYPYSSGCIDAKTGLLTDNTPDPAIASRVDAAVAASVVANARTASSLARRVANFQAARAVPAEAVNFGAAWRQAGIEGGRRYRKSKKAKKAKKSRKTKKSSR
jgi:hypothetical protein